MLSTDTHVRHGEAIPGIFNYIARNNIRGDFFGGLTAAVIAIPLALGVASGAIENAVEEAIEMGRMYRRWAPRAPDASNWSGSGCSRSCPKTTPITPATRH